jgi:toxin-antitoxin system PIN domain toxin
LIGVDTNILVYAHRRDSAFHVPARTCIDALAIGTAAWAIPWPCIHEFLAVVTGTRIFKPPSTMKQANAQVGAWLASPSLALLSESADHWSELERFLMAGQVRGGQVHDARIAAICIEHGVREFWSADRDFNRFPALKVVNPLLR